MPPIENGVPPKGDTPIDLGNFKTITSVVRADECGIEFAERYLAA